MVLSNDGKERQFTNLRTVRTYFELTRLPFPSLSICSELNAIWNSYFLPNKIRVFSFQFFNNSLPIGARLAGRYRTNAAVVVDERCTFCVRGNVRVPARETFLHLFYECGVLEQCIARFLEKYFGGLHNGDELRSFYFTGVGTDGELVDTRLNMLLVTLFNFFIWQSKLARKVPGFLSIENDMLTIFDASLNISKKLARIANEGQSYVSRSWRLRHGRG
jgi:hypothetical protein